MDKDPNLFDYLILWGSIVLSWLAGETGRVLVAGGAGGVVRWLATDRRRIEDGVLSCVGGVVCSIYMWPIILYLPTIPPISAPPIPETPDNIAMAAFVVGTMGISIVKIGSAVVRTWLRNNREGLDDDQAGS